MVWVVDEWKLCVAKTVKHDWVDLERRKLNETHKQTDDSLVTTETASN